MLSTLLLLSLITPSQQQDTVSGDLTNLATTLGMHTCESWNHDISNAGGLAYRDDLFSFLKQIEEDNKFLYEWQFGDDSVGVV